MHGRTARLSEPRLRVRLAGLGVSLDRWDRRLGAAYAGLADRRLVRALGRALATLLVAVLVLAKWQTVVHLLGTPRGGDDLTAWTIALNHLLQVPFLVLLLVLMLVRRHARTGTARLRGILAALGGTAAPAFLILESNGGLSAALAPLAIVLLLVGMGWGIWSLTVLGRCFSILPEVRGLVTNGPYRWVRHPVYLGEITATLGLLLPVLSTRNVAVFALFCALQLWRTRHEEAGLVATFPEYDDYRRRTARLLPGLW